MFFYRLPEQPSGFYFTYAVRLHCAVGAIALATCVPVADGT